MIIIAGQLTNPGSMRWRCWKKLLVHGKHFHALSQLNLLGSIKIARAFFALFAW